MNGCIPEYGTIILSAIRRVGIAISLLFASSQVAAGQTVDLGGLAYVDYFYTLSNPQEDAEGLHGFTYRRLYLTSDFTLSDEFFGRARIEANDGTDTSDGPVPFVKDLWLAWQYAGLHEARIGVMPPPAFELAEEVWGYRSLEQTILDFQNVNTSRDFGLRLNGPLVGAFSYAVMIANNSSIHPESDPYKRIYGQIEFHPTEQLSFGLGADRAGYENPRDGGTRVSGFAGYRSNNFSGGFEAYWHEITFDIGEAYRNVGASLFARYRISDEWELVGRMDRVEEGFGEATVSEHFYVLGSAYMPVNGVRLIPNLWWFGDDQDENPEVFARMTVEVSF